MQVRPLWLQSDPDLNRQFRRRWTEPPGPSRKCRFADSQTRGAGGGCDASGKEQSGDKAEDTARRRSAQWRAAEALFAPGGAA
jgi:hypothetical protein